ncbi:MAG: ABC transporter ATP-binding protein [Candidatus Heimdallarchaeaceae archaeon]
MSFIQNIPDEKYDRTYGDFYLLKRLFNYMGRHDLPTFFRVLFWMTIQTASGLGIPYFVKFVVRLIQEQSFTPLIYSYAAAVALLYGINWFAYYRVLFNLAILAGDMMRGIRKDCYKTLLRQDMAFYDENKSGKLVSRVTSDTNTISNMVQITAAFLINILTMITILILLFIADYWLATICIALLPILFVVAMGARVLARSTSKTWRKTIAIVNANVAESISGIEITKYFNQEEESFKRFQEINLRNYRAAIARAFGISIYFPLVETLFGIGTFLILYFGGYWTIVVQRIEVDELIFFILMLNRFFMPLMQITQFFNQFEAGLAAVERIFSLMDSEPKVKEKPDALPIKELKGDIKFDHMTFYYLPEEPLYENFTLHIPPGQKCAIVGKTGAGKSTLVSLLARLYDVKGGRIQIDDTDIRDYKLEDYRKQIGIVLQDNILFSGTIEENIRYGKMAATREEIIQAAKSVYAWEFIESLPKGLDTAVGEKGTKLSAGQRQLIAFARTLLSDPKILVLDEATSAIDAYTESLIQEALHVLLQGRTSIIIAHRLTTVENADRIIVIDNARICEEGTHQELMAKKGKYWQLYDMYFRHQSLEYIEKAKQLI